MSYRYIDTNAELLAYLDTLEENKCQVIALDTEANLHRYAYGQQLCLVQVCDGTDVLLIDPFNINRRNLRALFENRDILKVMYDAASDISLLVNSEELTIKSILDLRPGVELLNYEKNDLYSILGVEMGLTLAHKKKFQQYNWLRRPIPDEALEYAANDVRYMLGLKDIILKKVFEAGLMDSFILKNLRIQNRNYYIDTASRHRRVKGYSGLGEAERHLFKTLFFIREKYAEQINMPSGNVVSNNLLLEIACGDKSADDLQFPRKMDEAVRRQITDEIRQALPRAENKGVY